MDRRNDGGGGIVARMLPIPSRFLYLGCCGAITFSHNNFKPRHPEDTQESRRYTLCTKASPPRGLYLYALLVLCRRRPLHVTYRGAFVCKIYIYKTTYHNSKERNYVGSAFCADATKNNNKKKIGTSNQGTTVFTVLCSIECEPRNRGTVTAVAAKSHLRW